jgi:hypothetical protein
MTPSVDLIFPDPKLSETNSALITMYTSNLSTKHKIFKFKGQIRDVEGDV